MQKLEDEIDLQKTTSDPHSIRWRHVYSKHWQQQKHSI